MKKFFLAGLLAFIVGVGSISSNFAQAADSFEQDMLVLINHERTRHGVRPLVLDITLTRCANIRAREISEYFSHTRPNGKSCFSVLGNYRKSYLGENIAAGQENAEKFFEAWMQSKGHRENILNPRFRYLGVGYFYDANTQYNSYAVQIFKG